MLKSDFILTGEEINCERIICISHNSDLSEEEYGILLEKALMNDLELHPMYLYRIEGDKILSGLCNHETKDSALATNTRINRDQFESMVLEIQRANMHIRDFLGLPVSLSEYMDRLPDEYED